MACALIEMWNEKLRRWVNKGAKGIALIDDSLKKLALLNVFDISDTSRNSESEMALCEIGDTVRSTHIEERQALGGGNITIPEPFCQSHIVVK